MPAITGWGNSSLVQSAMEKNGENNQKARNIGQDINQMPALGSEHEKI
jgi:hypothetical protein